MPSVAVATLAGIATLIWAEPIANVLSRSDPAEVATYLRIFAPFIPLATAATVALAGTRGFGTMRPFVAIQSIATPSLKPILILLAAIGGITVTGLALGWALPEAFACAAALVVLVRRVRRAQGRGEAASASIAALAREFWAFSAPRGVAAAFQITIIWLDLLLLSHLRDASEVGIYGAVSRAVTIGTFALQAIRLAIAPQISRLLARGDRAQAQTVYQTATWWLIVVSWPLFLTLAVFGPALLGIFGPGFDQGATALAILSAAMLVNLGTGNVTVVLLMGGKSSWNLLNTAVALILNVGLNLVLIPRFGMEGAAIAWAVSIIVDNLMALTEVWVFLGMWPFGTGYLPAVSAALGCFGLVGLAVRATLGTTDVAFLVFTVIAIPAYAAVLWRFRRRLHLDDLVRAFGAGPRARPGQGGGWDTGSTRGRRGFLRPVARRIARAWCMATAPLRRPPDIIVLGTKRGGSTSLAAYLYAHPQVLPPVPARLAPKGVRAFDEHPDRGRWWYRSHFATVFARGTAKRRRRFAAESTANYLFHREEAARAAVLAPAARAVVLLRDPVERAWSHWRERTRRGLETLPFEDALAAEDERVRTLPAAARANVAYRAQGCSPTSCRPGKRRSATDCSSCLPRIFADPAGIYAQVVAFLGLQPFTLASFEASNQHPAADRMDAATRASLVDFYRPYDARLAELLGRSLPWHRTSEGFPSGGPGR